MKTETEKTQKRFTVEQADKDLFAIYNLMYTGADYDMWFDWEKRLQDT